MSDHFVFIVDDEPGIAALCTRLLNRAGFKSASETDPRKAIEYLKDHPIDLLLVDIRMPEVDGFEVIQHTQQLQPDAAILVMTGHGTVETAIHALRQGVDGLILKPFRKGDELIAAVNLALDDSQRKKDAARTQALRPLFNVTESLLSETRRQPLLKLIIEAVASHIQCSQAAIVQEMDAGKFSLIASNGIILDQNLFDLISTAGPDSNPRLITASKPGDTAFAPALSKLEVGFVMLAPTYRPKLRLFLYAGRSVDQPVFSDSDMELLQILSRQAITALENSRLYSEQLEYVRKIEESQRALLQSEKMATAGRLSASIAHEVNNPLHAVQNCLHLAGREDLPEEKRQEYFELARTELERLVTTVRRMLDFYRPNASDKEKVNLKEMLDYIINLMSKQLGDSGFKIITEIQTENPSVMAVSGQLQQVFINLMLNSADAIPEGGELKITFSRFGRGYEIIFHDNGPGIPLEKQENIFEPFFSTKDGGTGLGLTVSYNIITTHGGVLELLNDRGPGACFRIYLPEGEHQ